MKRAFLKAASVLPPFWQTLACSLPRILAVHFLNLLSNLSFSISLWRLSYIMANSRLPPPSKELQLKPDVTVWWMVWREWPSLGWHLSYIRRVCFKEKTGKKRGLDGWSWGKSPQDKSAKSCEGKGNPRFPSSATDWAARGSRGPWQEAQPTLQTCSRGPEPETPAATWKMLQVHSEIQAPFSGGGGVAQSWCFLCPSCLCVGKPRLHCSRIFYSKQHYWVDNNPNPTIWCFTSSFSLP